MNKKRVIVHYRNATRSVKQAIRSRYPGDITPYLIKVKAKKSFHALLVELEDMVYLVKMTVKKDRRGMVTDEWLFDKLGFGKEIES